MITVLLNIKGKGMIRKDLWFGQYTDTPPVNAEISLSILKVHTYLSSTLLPLVYNLVSVNPESRILVLF